MNIVTHFHHQFLTGYLQSRTASWKMHPCYPSRVKKIEARNYVENCWVRVNSVIACTCLPTTSLLPKLPEGAEKKKTLILPLILVIKLTGSILLTCDAVQEYHYSVARGERARAKKQPSSKGGLCAEQCLLFCFANGSYGNPRTLTYAVIATREHQSK